MIQAGPGQVVGGVVRPPAQAQLILDKGCHSWLTSPRTLDKFSVCIARRNKHIQTPLSEDLTSEEDCKGPEYNQLRSTCPYEDTQLLLKCGLCTDQPWRQAPGPRHESVCRLGRRLFSKNPSIFIGIRIWVWVTNRNFMV